MTIREFMYWLQGYFEITDSEIYPKDFEKKVKAHIELAKLCDKAPNPVLKANLDLIEVFLVNRNYPAIKQVLSNSFVHAIDGDYKVDQAVANQVHSGNPIPVNPVKPLANKPPKPPRPLDVDQHALDALNALHGYTARC